MSLLFWIFCIIATKVSQLVIKWFGGHSIKAWQLRCNQDHWALSVRLLFMLMKINSDFLEIWVYFLTGPHRENKYRVFFMNQDKPYNHCTPSSQFKLARPQPLFITMTTVALLHSWPCIVPKSNTCPNQRNIFLLDDANFKTPTLAGAFWSKTSKHET